MHGDRWVSMAKGGAIIRRYLWLIPLGDRDWETESRIDILCTI